MKVSNLIWICVKALFCKALIGTISTDFILTNWTKTMSTRSCLEQMQYMGSFTRVDFLEIPKCAMHPLVKTLKKPAGQGQEFEFLEENPEKNL